MPSSTDSGASTRCATTRPISARSRSDRSWSGEPEAVQMRRYLRATRRGRQGRISPYSTGSHSARGSSTTRGSARKRARNARTAAGSGAAGVPELTSRMPMRSAPAARSSGGTWYMPLTIAHSRLPRARPASADADAQVLDLGVVEDAVLGALATDARFLHAAKRGDLGGNEPGVQADDAVLERLGDPPGARQIAGIEI